MPDRIDTGVDGGSAENAAADWYTRRIHDRSSATERAFTRWLNADPAHRRAYDDILTEFGAEDQPGTGSRSRKFPRAPFFMRHNTHVAMAGAGALAVLGIVSVGVVQFGGPLQFVAPAQAATFETRLGEIRTFTLADGSKLTLDTNSRASAEFSSTMRHLHLSQGRARIDIKPDPQRPIVVTAGNAELTASGAAIDIGLGVGGTKIVGLHGVVDVQVAGTQATSPASQLSPGGQLMVENDRTISSIGPASADEARWVSGMLALDQTPLGTAVAAINRYNRTQVRLVDATLADLAVSGAFRADDPDGFAQQVATMFDLKLERSPGVIVLSRP